MDKITSKRVLDLTIAYQECEAMFRRNNHRLKLKEDVMNFVHNLARELYIVKERELDALKKKIKGKPVAAMKKAAMKVALKKKAKAAMKVAAKKKANFRRTRQRKH